MREHLTPKQLASAIGVSESSVKRWCDQGRIPTQRTAGGHRRIAVPDVLRFLRDSGHGIVRHEFLGLVRAKQGRALDLQQASDGLRADLEAGRVEAVRGTLLALYLARSSVPEICDQVIAPAFAGIGSAWSHGAVEIYQERRGSEMILRALHELRLALPVPPVCAPLAIGGSMAPDLYSITTTAAELCLREAGLRAQSLGPNNPAATLAAALRDQKPRLFWLTVSYVETPESFLRDYDELYAAASEVGAAVVVGGFALSEELRRQIRYTSHGDTMGHLVEFARALIPPKG